MLVASDVLLLNKEQGNIFGPVRLVNHLGPAGIGQ